MSESKKKDWAAISDDEDEESEEETSPVREPENTEQEPQETGQAVEDEPEEVYEEKTEAPKTEDQKKTEMISQINNANLPKVHLNVYNLRPEITEQDILDFYQPLKIDRIFKTNAKNPNPMLDLEFSNKEDALKIIEKGAGTIKNCKFQIRVSLRTLKPEAFKPRDKGGRNYGSNETRPYNKDRNYGSRDQDYGKRENKGYGGDRGDRGNKGYYDKPYEKRGEGGRRDDRGGRKPEGGYRDNRGENKYQAKDQPVMKEQVKKEEEDNKEPELPKEWQKAWENREELPKEWQKAWDQREQKDQKEYQGRDKYQSKGDSYNRGGKTEENKSDIQMKGRGQTKYGKEDNLEQDKILKGGYQGERGGKPYRRDRDEGEGGSNRNKYSNYNDKWSKEGDYQGGKYSKEGGPKMNSKQGSRNFEDKQQYVYVKKNPSDGKETSNLPDTTLTKRPSALKSQNTVNPFDLLPQ